MRIKSVHIRGIKSIKDFKLDLAAKSGWHVLLGDNGTGKSTVLKCISLALLGRRQATYLNPSYVNWVNHEAFEGSCEIFVLCDAQHDDIGAGTDFLDSFGLDFKFEIKINKVFSKDIASSLTNMSKTLKEELEFKKGDGWFSCAFGPYRRFGRELNDKELDFRLQAHLNLFDNNYTLTSAIEWLKQKKFKSLEQKSGNNKTIEKLIAAINKSDFLPNQIKISEVSSDGVKFEDANTNELKLSDLSDGYQSILALLFEILRQLEVHYEDQGFTQNKEGQFTMPGVVLVDEIDLHLHPTWQAKIGKWLTHHFPNIQFIVTTHSPIICQSASNGTIWKMEYPGTGMESRQLTGQDYNRLVYGNLLDAYSSSGFGYDSVTRSDKSADLRQELAKLSLNNRKRTLSDAERKRFEELKQIFPTSEITF